jgi:hypothetical protein
VRYIFVLAESRSRSPKDGREDEKLWLFETLALQPAARAGRGSGFSNFLARNPLKRLDSEK